jgi:hypothetical protein
VFKWMHIYDRWDAGEEKNGTYQQCALALALALLRIGAFTASAPIDSSLQLGHDRGVVARHIRDCSCGASAPDSACRERAHQIDVVE